MEVLTVLSRFFVHAPIAEKPRFQNELIWELIENASAPILYIYYG